jgi:hypothetical protein
MSGVILRLDAPAGAAFAVCRMKCQDVPVIKEWLRLRPAPAGRGVSTLGVGVGVGTAREVESVRAAFGGTS